MAFTFTFPKKLIKLSLIILSLSFCNSSYGQEDTIKYEIEAQTIATTNGVVPFWMRSNQYGSIPLAGISQSFIGRAFKDYKNTDLTSSQGHKKALFDWGFGFEGRTNLGKNSNLKLIEAYGKIKAGIFQLKAGRSKDVMGLNGDTTLSSGNFSVSGNALGVPKVEISIPEYYTLPILNGLISIKGNFAHGWLGKVKILDSLDILNGKATFTPNNNYPNTFFHQKSFYGRIGKTNWKLKLFGGFNHQVYWGNEKSAYGSNFNLSTLESLLYVTIGKTYGENGIPTSKIGNQLGSIDVGAEYNFDKIKLMIYRQNFFDVGALSKLANISDGLNGFILVNKNFNSDSKNFKWKRILFEFFYSKDQAGYPWSIPTKSGDEDYYNNYYYKDGWSYNNLGLGSPFITSRSDAKINQAYKEVDYFINNRIIAGHFGFYGKISGLDFLTKISYSRNYGTFGTSIYGNSIGMIRNTNYNNKSNIFTPVNQLSLDLEGFKNLQNGLTVGLASSLDHGNLLNNSFGLIFKVKKTF